MHAFIAAVHPDIAAVDQHVDHFFEEERVACCRGREPLAQRLGRRRRQAGQQGVGECRGIVVAQRLQVDPARAQRAAPGRAQQGHLGPRQSQEHQRDVGVARLQQLDEVQRAGVGPVQVVQQHQQRRAAGGQRAQRLRGMEEGAVAQLLRFLQQRLHLGVRGKVQAQQLPQHRRVALAAQQRRQRLQPVRACQRGAVAVPDAGVARKELAQQAVGPASVAFSGPCFQAALASGLLRGAQAKFARQARLADAGLCHHHHGAQPAACRPGLLQRCQLSAAADAGRGHASHTAFGVQRCVSQRAVHEPGAHGFVTALDLQRRLRAAVKLPAHQAPGVGADAQRAGRRGLLHARGDVDRHAADAAFAIHTAAQQHRPGGDAGAHAKAAQAVALLHRSRMGLRFLQRGQRGVDGGGGVAFVGHGRAPHRQQAVARVLQHRAVVAVDDTRDAGQCAVHHGVDVFGRQVLAQRRRAHHVAKQHADLAQLLHLLSIGLGIAALLARQLFAQRRQRQVHDVGTQPFPLRFQLRDGQQQSFLGRCHGLAP